MYKTFNGWRDSLPFLLDIRRSNLKEKKVGEIVSSNFYSLLALVACWGNHCPHFRFTKFKMERKNSPTRGIPTKFKECRQRFPHHATSTNGVLLIQAINAGLKKVYSMEWHSWSFIKELSSKKNWHRYEIVMHKKHRVKGRSSNVYIFSD